MKGGASCNGLQWEGAGLREGAGLEGGGGAERLYGKGAGLQGMGCNGRRRSYGRGRGYVGAGLRIIGWKRRGGATE